MPVWHIAGYDEASSEEVAEIGALTQRAMRIAREVMGCDGFNLGMNQGAIAGAGGRRAPAPTHRAPVGLGCKLFPDYREDEGAAAAPWRGAREAGDGLG